jgi:hypothetical protein
MKYAVAGIVAVSLILNGCAKSGPPLPSETADAAEMCFAAQLKSLNDQNTPKLSPKAALGPLEFFNVLAVKSRANGKPAMTDFQQFGDGAAVKAKYEKTEHLVDALPECMKRFPLANADATVTLPSDEGERNALCFYAGAYGAGRVKSGKVDSDAVTAKAESYFNLTSDPTNPIILSIANKYTVTSAEDGVRVAADVMGHTTDVGNVYSILVACPSP